MSNFSRQTVNNLKMINDVGGITYNSVNLGSTDGGVTITNAKEMVYLSTDQTIGNIIAEITNQTMQVTMNLAENSLENLATAMNLPATRVTSAASSTTLDLIPDRTAITASLVINGRSGSGVSTAYNRVFTFPRAVSAGSSASSYTKNGIAFVPVTFDILINTSTGTFGTIVDDNK